MNRLITSMVQLSLAIPAYYCVRYMIADYYQQKKSENK